MPDLPPLTESVPWWESASYFAAVTAVTIAADWVRRLVLAPRPEKPKKTEDHEHRRKDDPKNVHYEHRRQDDP